MPVTYDELDLALNEIRLCDILPGKAAREGPHDDGDPIRLVLRHVPLVFPPELPTLTTQRLTASQLRKTLPHGWWCEETATPNYRFVFEDPDENTRWTHPNPDIDHDLWRELDELPPPGFTPNYEALSYAWGPEEVAETAQVEYEYPQRNDIPRQTMTLNIRRNLANALRALRYADKPRTMWIDAICIDQTNTKERSTQLKRMQQIYSLAHRVVVWLGAETSSTKIALDTLRYMGEQIELSRNGTRFCAPNAVEKDWLHISGKITLPYDDATWRAVGDLLSKSWFERLWVCQEIQLANSHAVLICGSHMIGWYSFKKGIEMMGAHLVPVADVRRRADKIRHMTMELKSAALYELLEFGRNQNCSEPRDHLYGLLSMYGPELRNRIHPTYDRTTKLHNIFKDLFIEYLKLTRRLDLLSGCYENLRDVAVDHEQFSPESPSWVPNWSVGTNATMLYDHSCASGMSPAEFEYGGDRDDSDVLVVKGVHGPRVKKVIFSDAVPHSPARYPEMVRQLTSLEPHDLHNRSYDPIPEKTLLEIYLETLRIGVVSERYGIGSEITLEQWQSHYMDICQRIARGSGNEDGDENGDEDDNHLDYHRLPMPELGRVLGVIQYRSLFECDDGHLGIGPPGVQPGDIVSVLLGCRSSIMLRPTATPSASSSSSSSLSPEEAKEKGGESSEEQEYTVLGESWVYGLFEGQGVLGPLPAGWALHFERGDIGYGYDVCFRNAATGDERPVGGDPRLPPLPPQWAHVERERRPDDPALWDCYRNADTGEEINYDPRMTADELLKRGVKLREFKLI